MTDSPSVAAIRKAAAAFNRGDVDGYLSDIDPSCSRWIVGFDTALSVSDMRDQVLQMFQSFSDLELSAEALFGQDDSVCARWRLRGTHVGEFLGVAPSGRRIDVRTCEIYELRDGLVREVWTYGNPMDVLRQIEPATDVVSDALGPTELLDPEVIDNPYPFYQRLLAQAPVWRVPGTAVVVVSSFELVTEAITRVDDFSSNMKCLLYKDDAGLPRQLSFGDLGQQTLATADPPDHARHRMTVFPELVAKRMLSLGPAISELAISCVRTAVAEQSTDFMATVGNIVPITVMNNLVGFHESDPAVLLQGAFDSTAALGGVLSLAELDALIVRIGTVHDWIASQLERADTEAGGQLLGTIAHGVSTGAFGQYEATVMLHTLLSAGGETTSSLLGNAVRILAERPDLQDQLRANPSLVPAFIEEVLRLESPFRVMMRSVPANTMLGRTELNAGDTLLLNFGAANRDPRQWDRPDHIDLERDLARAHLAFGKGIHYCVGARLARLEADIVIRELLARTSSIELNPEEPPRLVRSLLVRRLASLPLRLTPAS